MVTARLDAWLSRSVPRGGQLLPLKQGSLDGLCGLYAAINALRVICPEYNKRDDIWAEVFEVLVAKTEHRVGLHRAVLQGLTSPTLISIVDDARPELEIDFGIRLNLHRPFSTTAPLSRSAIGLRLAWHSRERNEAVLGVANSPVPHWLVITEVNGVALHVLDSATPAPDTNALSGGPHLWSLDAIDPSSVVVLQRLT